MNLLVIGSEGFIGRHIIQHYILRGGQVFGLDLVAASSQAYYYTQIASIKNDFSRILESNRFDIIINAAGSGNVPYSMTHPLIDFQANVYDTAYILEAIRLYQPHIRYIHISSAAVYGNPTVLPIKEADVCAPLSPYGWHKYMSELSCKEYYTVYGINTAIVRPFSVYGPGLRKQLFWDLYQKVKSSEANATVELWGTGRESRDYIYVKDLAVAIATIVEADGFTGTIYNLASGKETAISTAVSAFLSRYRPDISVVFNNQVRQGDPLNWCADITSLVNTGYTPQYSFEEGMEELVEWIKSL